MGLPLTIEAAVHDAGSSLPQHLPVLLEASMEWLAPRAGGLYVDGTLGAGGHTEALLQRSGPDGRVIGIDRDPAALQLAASRLAEFGDRLIPVHGLHEEVIDILDRLGIETIDGLLLDLGVSSMQLDQAERGFSFRHDGPLDLRMDPSGGAPSAADYLANVEESELRRVLRVYGEEREAGRIARTIVRRRETQPLRRTAELAQLIEERLPAAQRFRIHPATRTFQALRIVCNGELERLAATLEAVAERLAPGGRLVVISYHSLEDRPVKQTFRGLAAGPEVPRHLPVRDDALTAPFALPFRRALRPDEAEIGANPRARSARLRVLERRR